MARELAESRRARFRAMTVAERLAELTPRQREIYDTIAASWREKGYGPTVRELGDVVGIAATNGVVCHLTALAKKGLVVENRDAQGRQLARSLNVVTDSEPCPACGQAVPCKGGRP